MEAVERVLESLNQLCISISDFKQHRVEQATYHSPVIDHFHPDDYSQRAVTGLTKFLGHAETERDHVLGIYNSGNPPKDLSTNAPNLTAIWDEVLRSSWPICAVAHHLECGGEGLIKIDVVAEGGDLWVKINTIKESRLMAEFREQDSYINSDYDSDSDSQSSAGPEKRPLRNSLIKQADTLLQAAKAHSRPLGLPPPRIRYVLDRFDASPNGSYADERIAATFATIRQMGVELVLGSQPIPPMPSRPLPKLIPTNRIILDLSVVVALCCDSTHQPLPRTDEELEARFRPLKLGENGEMILGEHTNISKDLRDQLSWERDHPIIDEIQRRLGEAGHETVEWFVTQEVKDRTPGIVDYIGGPQEQARARALYGESDEDFWIGSRYAGHEGILRDMKVRVIDDLDAGLSAVSLETLSSFDQGVIAVCSRMLSSVENASAAPAAAPSPPTTPVKRRGRRARGPKKPYAVFPPTQRLPSAHTLRTMMKGVQAGMTVLTNNRGAVGKVVREMGVTEGLPFEGQPKSVEKVGLWVVNPSSLAEWRRVEVETANHALRCGGETIVVPPMGGRHENRDREHKHMHF